MVETKGLGWSADGGDKRVWVSSFGSWVSSMRVREREREREREIIRFVLFFKKKK